MTAGRERIMLGPLLLLVSAIALLASRPSRAAESSDAGGPRFSAQAAATFNSRCTACHTYGKGIKVGPDL